MAITDKLGTLDSQPGSITPGAGATGVPLVSRLSQMVVETLVLPFPRGRLSQFVVETLVNPASRGRVSQFVVEYLVAPPSISRVSQVVVEHLEPSSGSGDSALNGPWLGGGGSNIWIE